MTSCVILFRGSLYGTSVGEGCLSWYHTSQEPVGLSRNFLMLVKGLHCPFGTWHFPGVKSPHMLTFISLGANWHRRTLKPRYGPVGSVLVPTVLEGGHLMRTRRHVFSFTPSIRQDLQTQEFPQMRLRGCCAAVAFCSGLVVLLAQLVASSCSIS